MKNKAFALLLICVALLFTSCSASFTDAEAYAQKLADEGYTVYIITSGDSSASEDLLVIKLIFEYVILQNDGDITAQKVLLASDTSPIEIICVFYYGSENEAKTAENIIKNSSEQLNSLFGNDVLYGFEAKGSALKITVTELLD